MSPYVGWQRLVPLEGLQVAARIEIAAENIIAGSGREHERASSVKAEIKNALPCATTSPIHDCCDGLAVTDAGRQPDILIGAIQVEHMAVNGIVLNRSAVLKQSEILMVVVFGICFKSITRGPVVGEDGPIIRGP